MATPKSKELLDQIEIDGDLLSYVSYATYYGRQSLFTSFRMGNNGDKSIEDLIVHVTCDTPLVLPQDVTVEEISPESVIEVEFPQMLNPKYLADLSEPATCQVTVAITSGKITLCELSSSVIAMPLTYWCGLGGDVQTLAHFVRPKLADSKKILAEAGLQLKTWGYSSEFTGYASNDKNAVRNAFAAIYSAVRNLNIDRVELPDLTAPVDTGDITQIISSKQATPLQMALFVSSCLESIRLNPIILLGQSSIGVGVWLYESCFTSPVQDDMSLIAKYLQEGVSNLAILDVNDLFTHKNASFTTACAHLLNRLSSGEFELALDVKRSRIGGIFPVPLKVKTRDGYELLNAEQSSYDQKPDELLDVDRLVKSKGATKDKSWQRRLLDLSMKNNLLAFRYQKDGLHIRVVNVELFNEKLSQNTHYTLLPTLYEGVLPFGNRVESALSELNAIELSAGNMRVYTDESALQETVASLIRKAKSAEEEVGDRTLYLATGFLKWARPDEREPRYAPLALLPVSLKKTKAGITLDVVGDYQVNTTLLEFLKQEFALDIRGLQDATLTPTQMIAVFRSQTANRKGWEVYDDVYLAQFTFARFAMWKDVKDNMAVYRNNPLIQSLLTNANCLSTNALKGAGEDEANPQNVLTPLSCDSSQFQAVTESAMGTSFVLHGPPGTGKSQTITNIIANAVYQGKRVLFVAEKQAALQVVQKRLNDIGIGEFCLEMHSGKSTDKAELVRAISNTLSLKKEEGEVPFVAKAEEIVSVRSTLKKPFDAMHKKRRLGVSLYEAILYYFQNKTAPELVNIESTFYDSLTADKLKRYESMLTTAQAAAKECGGVYRSPFDNVNLTKCTSATKRSVQCASEVALAELKHFKNYLNLFLDTFNQKMSTFTYKKLEAIIELATMLKEKSLNVFYDCQEEEFYKFYNANVRYDGAVKHWLSHFKTLPDIQKLAPQIEAELETWGDNYRSSKVILAVLKRISKCGGEVKSADELEWIKRAYEMEQARCAILSNTNLSQNFMSFGDINDKKREEFLRPLYHLHELGKAIFMDYNADSFNSVCSHKGEGWLSPLLTGFISASVSFTRATDHFCSAVKADKQEILDEDLFVYYQTKCTALLDNLDMLPAWCSYKEMAEELNKNGLTFMTDAMESGRISGDKILSSFRKNVYRNFIQTIIPSDDDLSQFSAGVLDENATAFHRLLEEYIRLTRQQIRSTLISRLPAPETEGALALEVMAFQRMAKGNLKSLNLRTLFAEVPELLKVVCPCMLMSPSTVSQYLAPDPQLFDIVIFDEASQLPTAEAVPSLARAKSAIIVGDPNQMPPTSFFNGNGLDEDNPEMDDLESVLEDCLALGIPERHLNWHYRSKHESLIAFSNVMYYSGRLCTFPSPDALDSKVRLHYLENGTYARGEKKTNKQEAEAIVDEVIRRLKDIKTQRASIGIVTFSTPQQVYIERLLARAIASNGLEEVAYEREEPLFVKNLENVQGDERDVILFSVCYGPDEMGKISLNFGPLNQVGGWRRLNVAVSRAREEMVIFSSMRYSMIDLNRTNARGVAGLRAFLEFAEKGKTNLAVNNSSVTAYNGIGKYVAQELSAYGYDCRCNVGVSDFKIDVAVVDPKNKHNFILAILCDGVGNFSVKDRAVLQVQTLKRNNWNVIRLYALNFFNNPKREIKKIKDYLDMITSTSKNSSINFRRPYRVAKIEEKVVDSAYILADENDVDIMRTIKAVVTAEEPISQDFLIKRVLSLYGITKYGVRLEGKVQKLILACGFPAVKLCGNTYYYKTAKALSYDKYRIESGTALRTSDTDFTPYDVISLIRNTLYNKVSMYQDELITTIVKEFKVRLSDKLTAFIISCIELGVYEGVLIRSIADKISLA